MANGLILVFNNRLCWRAVEIGCWKMRCLSLLLFNIGIEIGQIIIVAFTADYGYGENQRSLNLCHAIDSSAAYAGDCGHVLDD